MQGATLGGNLGANLGLIHHSDRGSQYCANAYQAKLRENGIAVSMSGKGNAFDNAMVETFFKTLKTELVWRTTFKTRHEAISAIARYIDGFYNPSRRHAAAHGSAPKGRAFGLAQGIDVAAALAAAGLVAMPALADLRDQDLRDTAVTWLALAGCTEHEIASITGHSLKTIKDIMSHYLGMHPDHGRRAIAKMEKWSER